MWVYRMRLVSRRGTRWFEASHAVPDHEYAVPALRANVERLVERALRRVDGVTPDMPLQCLGWFHLEGQDNDASAGTSTALPGWAFRDGYLRDRAST